MADLFEAVSRGAAALPVQSCSSGSLPGWVGALDVVIAVSQSGRAAGTLALAAEAARRGAFLVTVGARGLAAGRRLRPGPRRARADRRQRSLVTHLGVGAGHAGAARRRRHGHRVRQPRDARPSSPTSSTARPPTRGRRPSRSSTRPRCSRPSSPSRRPIVLGEGPFGDVTARRAAAMFGRTGRVPVAHGCLPDAASQIVACFDGPLAPGQSGGGGSDDIFADPFLDGPSRPPLRLIMLRDTSPGRRARAGRHRRLRRRGRRCARVARRRPRGRPAAAPRPPRRPHRLRRDLPRARLRLRPRDVAARAAAAGRPRGPDRPSPPRAYAARAGRAAPGAVPGRRGVPRRLPR